MTDTILIIPINQSKKACTLLEKNGVDFTVDAYASEIEKGKTIPIESAFSKLKTYKTKPKQKVKDKSRDLASHHNLTVFAKQLGYDSISHAISQIGSGRKFRILFNENFKKVK